MSRRERDKKWKGEENKSVRTKKGKNKEEKEKECIKK